MKPLVRITLALITVLGMQGCEKNAPGGNDDEQPAWQQGCNIVSHEDVEHGSYSAIKNARTVVVDNQSDWESLYKDIHRNVKPTGNPPSIDFSTYAVIGVFSGEKPTGGYQVNITELCNDGDYLRVKYTETAPGQGCIVTMALTQPYHLVKVRKSPICTFVKFDRTVDTLHCDQSGSCDQPLTFNTIRISQESGTGMADAGNHIIETDSAWNQLWSEMHGAHMDVPPLPEVDFSEHMVIAAFQGMQGTGGYAIEIKEICQDSGTIEVDVGKTVPGKYCIVTQALTYPYHLVLLNRSDLQVKFNETTIVRKCK